MVVVVVAVVVSGEIKGGAFWPDWALAGRLIGCLSFNSGRVKFAEL